jgi:hypothetical protein
MPDKEKAKDESSTQSQMRSEYAEYAKGGIVTKPTKAIIGEKGPEAVIPLRHGIKGELESILKPKPIAPPAPIRKKRTLGDIYTTLEAQRIFNPGMPSIPKPPSAPPANQQDRGTAAALGMEEAWGQPRDKNA